MKQTDDRMYSGWVQIRGATPDRTGLTATHLRVDVWFHERRGYFLTVAGVERGDQGFETSLLLSDRNQRSRLEEAARFSRPKLLLWVEKVQECLTEAQGSFWLTVLQVVDNHGAQVSK